MTPILAIVIMFTGIIWASTQGYQDYSNIKGTETYLFCSGEGGYSTFRIPSLYAIDKDVLNEKSGSNLENDLLIAFSEGRKNSSGDLGEIDLVYKTSIDNGKTWFPLRVLLKVEIGIGKVGNPTAIFDRDTGYLNLLYLVGKESDGYDYRTYNSRYAFDEDLNISTVGEPILLNEDIDENAQNGKYDGVTKNTLMPGPGKGIQLGSGRLLFPCSNQGRAYAMYSDDNGLNWEKGGDAGVGNECEMAKLDNGELIMVIRDNLQMGNLTKQHLRFAYSDDNGETWYKQASESTLKTPICMSSIATLNGDLMVTYTDDYFARTRLSVALSKDNGKTFNSKLIYGGASGYSCVTVTSNGKVFMLAEVGKINYNESLVFVEVDTKNF